jgi:hypothetical protein
VRDLIRASQEAKARRAKANGHDRDLKQEAVTKAFNIANDILSEIRTRYPDESDVEHIVRFRRAIENSTDADVLHCFVGDDDSEWIEIAI